MNHTNTGQYLKRRAWLKDRPNISNADAAHNWGCTEAAIRADKRALGIKSNRKDEKFRELGWGDVACPLKKVFLKYAWDGRKIQIDECRV